MVGDPAMSVREYLSTSYDPDREYLDGELRERNVGERDHSELQMAVAAWLYARRRELSIHVYPEQRVKVGAKRYRVPDVCVVAGHKPEELVFERPPFLCIEILSKDDRMQDVQEKIDDYLGCGVRYVWIINPRNRKAQAYAPDGITEVRDGVLRTENPSIALPLGEIFAEL